MLRAWARPEGFRHEGGFWTLNVPRLRAVPQTIPGDAAPLAEVASLPI